MKPGPDKCRRQLFGRAAAGPSEVSNSRETKGMAERDCATGLSPAPLGR
jgi:hypothetical protein